jgi:hypothetical protein
LAGKCHWGKGRGVHFQEDEEGKAETEAKLSGGGKTRKANSDEDRRGFDEILEVADA